MHFPEYSLDFRLDRANKFKVINRAVQSSKFIIDNHMTIKQIEFIKTIEEKLKIKFSGQTKAEARKYISDHIDEFYNQQNKNL